MKSLHISKEPACHFGSDTLRDLHPNSQHLAPFGSSIIYFYLHDTACGDWFEHTQLSKDPVNDISLCQIRERERDVYQNALSHRKLHNTGPMAHSDSVPLEVYIKYCNSKSLLHSRALGNRFSKKSLYFCLWLLEWAFGPVQNNFCCTTCPGT